MPELPEVQTTVDGLNTEVKNWIISDVWTDYKSPFHAQKDNIKNPKFFSHFKKQIIGWKIIGASRRAKNILIHLANKQTILIHMKMTGHIMCGEYVFSKSTYLKSIKKLVGGNDPWKAADTNSKNPLNDPFNRFIHLVFTLKHSGLKKEKHLVLSDMRKFAKVTLLPTDEAVYGQEKHPELSHLGPEPLDPAFTSELFIERLSKRPTAPIKQTLMDQTLIAGIGNIYSDEILWRANIHPKSHFGKIPQPVRKEMFKATKEMLLKGIDFGGDSMSDYRNIYGLPGKFQGQHKAYRKTGKPCEKKIGVKKCPGTIKRMVIGGRSSHFCDTHQILFH